PAAPHHRTADRPQRLIPTGRGYASGWGREPCRSTTTVDGRGHTVGRMKKWVTAIAVLVDLSAVGSLVYWQWDPIWAFVFSPVGGFVTKILFTAKAVKVVVGAGFAAAAGVVAAKRKLRRG